MVLFGAAAIAQAILAAMIAIKILSKKSLLGATDSKHISELKRNRRIAGLVLSTFFVSFSSCLMEMFTYPAILCQWSYGPYCMLGMSTSSTTVLQATVGQKMNTA